MSAFFWGELKKTTHLLKLDHDFQAKKKQATLEIPKLDEAFFFFGQMGFYRQLNFFWGKSFVGKSVNVGELGCWFSSISEFDNFGKVSFIGTSGFSTGWKLQMCRFCCSESSCYFLGHISVLMPRKKGCRKMGQIGVFRLEAFVVLEGRDVYSPLRAQHANGWLGWDGLPESFRCLALMGFGYIVHWVVHRRVGCFI